MIHTSTALVLAGLVLAACACQTQVAPPATTLPREAACEPTHPVRIEREPVLSPTAANVIHVRMLRHGEQARALLEAVLRLDRGQTRALAAAIADEPRLARPSSDSDLVNAQFPAQFFPLQDELHDAARALEAEAAAGNDAAMALSYGRLATTCVSCHAVYFR